MIRRTLPKTKDATFSIQLPSAQHHGMPTPTGTGFFVSPDGWFVTAAHVITENHQSNGPVRSDINQAWLMKETRIDVGRPGAMCQAVSFAHILPNLDFVLLKVDFTANANKEWLSGRSDFPFLLVSGRELEEGEAVYSFGYPLSGAFAQKVEHAVVGGTSLSPRVTSAIVSATVEQTRMIITGSDPKVYVLDKALNYGNSGGPIVATETGHAHALCSRFQPVFVPQSHLRDAKGNQMAVMIPSLYGVVSSLGNEQVLDLMKSLNIPIYDT